MARRAPSARVSAPEWRGADYAGACRGRGVVVPSKKVAPVKNQLRVAIVTAALSAGVVLSPLAAVASPASASRPASAVASVQPGESITGATGRRSATFSMRDTFAREITRYGDADTSPYHIEHVTELQYRLRWAGVHSANITGYFGPSTRKAVNRYQKREGLNVTGVANHRTWAHLLHDTVRHRGAIPHICRRAGWHACYDRSMHQVTLWHRGALRNTWLVRGGDSSYPTRVGNTRVYLRDKNHISTIYGTPMPYSQFFNGGQALHGSPFMMDPFVDHSHGCVNMYIEDARQLWSMTSTKRLYVSVYGAWD
jgi:peptidoglycan hydrolase-like protein with peptidoglycan-binding domain